MSSRSASPYAAPAVENALAILETLGTSHQMGVTGLAKKLGLSKSSVYRLLATLVRRGYAEQDPESERYQLTYRLFVVGSRAADRLGLRESADPVMKQLAAETGETVNLGVLAGVRVVNLHRVESHHLVRMHLQMGAWLPAHATALGKALLAYLEPQELARRLRGVRLERLTPRTISDRPTLRRAMARIREQGFAIDDEECSLGLRCVAAPILDHGGSAVAALSVSGLTQRLSLASLPSVAGTVRAAVHEVSRRLGYAADSMGERGMRLTRAGRHDSASGRANAGTKARARQSHQRGRLADR